VATTIAITAAAATPDTSIRRRRLDVRSAVGVRDIVVIGSASATARATAASSPAPGSAHVEESPRTSANSGSSAVSLGSRPPAATRASVAGGWRERLGLGGLGGAPRRAHVRPRARCPRDFWRQRTREDAGGGGLFLRGRDSGALHGHRSKRSPTFRPLRPRP